MSYDHADELDAVTEELEEVRRKLATVTEERDAARVELQETQERRDELEGLAFDLRDELERQTKEIRDLEAGSGATDDLIERCRRLL